VAAGLRFLLMATSEWQMLPRKNNILKKHRKLKHQQHKNTRVKQFDMYGRKLRV